MLWQFVSRQACRLSNILVTRSFKCFQEAIINLTDTFLEIRHITICVGQVS